MKYCVLIAGLFMAVPAFAEPTSLQELRTISVNGQVERLVVPDQAILTVNLNAMKKELSDAKAAHDRKLTQLMAIIRDARISEKKMRANNSNVQPQYESRRIDKQNRHESFLVGYRVHSNITITLDDTSKLVLTGHVWISRKQPWLDLDPDLPAWETQPASQEEWELLWSGGR